ncbi:MAG: hypothetical protein CO042_02785, partial [Parcubacteria group bacterium CG_4_9_14_0_2_um_filter_41_8]
ETTRSFAPEQMTFSNALALAQSSVEPIVSAAEQALKTPANISSKIISFLNPNEMSSMLARMSGSAIEISDSMMRVDPLSSVFDSISWLADKVNLGNILQPAGVYVARVSDGTRDPSASGLPLAQSLPRVFRG